MLLKNKRLFTFLALTISLLTPLIFTSCGGSSSSDEIEYESDDGADLEDTEFCKNLGNNKSITLTGVYGKKLLYANYNNARPSTDTTIPAHSTRYITSTIGIDQENTFSDFESTIGRTTASYPIKESETFKQHIKKFEEPRALRKKVLSGLRKASRSAARSISYNHDSNSIYDNNQLVELYNSGSIPITRSIYVDISQDMDTYEQRDATLRAIGYYNDQTPVPVVLVWVVNTYFGDECTDTTVNQDLAQDVADKFAAHYYHERAVFGEEYDFLFDANYRSSPTEAYKIAHTGSLVNIVIYDIANDFYSENAEGVAGYFFGTKDYFKRNNFRDARACSNEGKYFYLDSAFCNYCEDGNFSNPSSTISELSLTTLFHEFQHMIHFGQKTIYGIESETWYNEMLSMLCEDMMAEQLGTNQSCYAPWITRIQNLRQGYALSGIDEFRNDANFTLCSYATAYTFGAWLSREFGGPQFVRSMSQNHSYANMDSVLCSIYDRTGMEYSKRQIYKLFIQACVFQNRFANEHGLPTVNKAASGDISAYGYTSHMDAIDLYINTTSSGNRSGPRIFANGWTPDIRPHGFVIHSIGRATSDTVTLNFSSRISSHEDVMIYIQDDFED